MKYLLPFVIIFPIYAAGQDCNLKKNKDAYTGKHSLSTGFFTVGSFSLSIDVTQKEIDYFFVFKGTGNKCFDEQTIFTCIMTGGKQKFLLRNKGSMNCDGILHLIIANNPTTIPTALQKLSTQKIISFRITLGDASTTDYLIDTNTQNSLMEKSACIAQKKQKQWLFRK